MTNASNYLGNIQLLLVKYNTMLYTMKLYPWYNTMDCIMVYINQYYHAISLINVMHKGLSLQDSLQAVKKFLETYHSHGQGVTPNHALIKPVNLISQFNLFH